MTAFIPQMSRPITKNGELVPLQSNAVIRMADLCVLFNDHHVLLCADHAAPLAQKFPMFSIAQRRRACEVCWELRKVTKAKRCQGKR